MKNQSKIYAKFMDKNFATDYLTDTFYINHYIMLEIQQIL